MPEFHQPHSEEPAFPAAGGRRVVFLLDAASRLEEKLLRGWIERQTPPGVAFLVLGIPSSRRRRGRIDPRLEPALAAGDDPLLAPLRVVWRPRERDGVRQARLSDLLKLGDPRDPGRLREHYVLRSAPERVRIIAGAPAAASALRERWRSSAGTDAGATVGLAEFVVRQADLVLDIAERRLRGARYKVPRFVHEDVLWRPAFRGELHRLASALGRPYPAVPPTGVSAGETSRSSLQDLSVRGVIGRRSAPRTAACSACPPPVGFPRVTRRRDPLQWSAGQPGPIEWQFTPSGQAEPRGRRRSPLAP